MPKYTVTLPPKVEKALEEISKEESVSKPEIMRRAIALYHCLYKETTKGGDTFILEKNGNMKQIVFI